MALTSPRFAHNKRLQDASENKPPLYRIDRGEAVKILQQALSDLGYVMPLSFATGPPNGIYGDETVHTVQQFQRDQKFPFSGCDGRAGRDTMTRLDQLFAGGGPSGPPGTLPPPTDERFVGFSPTRRAILQEDIRVAKQLAAACFSSLLPTLPLPLDPKVAELLKDTFDTNGRDPLKVAHIQKRFSNFGGRMETVKFIFSADHPPERHVAFVIIPHYGFTLNEIFITEDYFKPNLGTGNIPPISPQTARALALIHEHIHLEGDVRDHPGGQPVAFERDRMNIPYPQAKWNPWCFENYAKWLRKAGRNHQPW